jgi:hypothetical protein
MGGPGHDRQIDERDQDWEVRRAGSQEGREEGESESVHQSPLAHMW